MTANSALLEPKLCFRCLMSCDRGWIEDVVIKHGTTAGACICIQVIIFRHMKASTGQQGPLLPTNMRRWPYVHHNAHEQHAPNSNNTFHTSSSMLFDAPADQPTKETAFRAAALQNARKQAFWIQWLTDSRDATKTTLFSSQTNWLLPIVPIAILSESLGCNSIAVFLLNFAAMLPLASLLSYSTEELSAHVGQTFGGLINATFGNLIELIVSHAPKCYTSSYSMPSH